METFLLGVLINCITYIGKRYNISGKILSIGSAGIIYILIYIAESYFPIQKEEAIRVAGEAYAFSQLVYNLWLKDSNKEPDKSVSL